MIYTLTLNPSVDYIVRLKQFQLGALNRTEAEAKYPGGKGINVSRVLKQFGVNSIAFGFAGGFTGAYIIESLQKEQIKPEFVQIDEDSRINIKLKTSEESEINAQGPNISQQAFQSLKDKIRALTSDDLLVIAGSIPAVLPETTYQDLVKICRENGAKFVVDAEGDLLKNVLPYGPLLIKPNHHELGALFNTTISEATEVIPHARKLVELGAQNVIVSLADKGAVFINANHSYIAEVPQGIVKNSVGAGDSMVAGFLAEFERTGDLKEAFRYSVASGSATAFSLGLCSKQKVEELLPQVQIQELF